MGARTGGVQGARRRCAAGHGQPAARAALLRGARGVARRRRRRGARADGQRRDPPDRPGERAHRGRPRVPRCRRPGARGYCGDGHAGRLGAGRWGGGQRAREHRRLHVVPGVVRVVQLPAPRRQRAGGGLAPGVRQPARAHAAQRWPGRRHAVRGRRRDGAARGRARHRAARPLRRRPVAAATRTPRDRVGARAAGCSTRRSCRSSRASPR